MELPCTSAQRVFSHCFRLISSVTQRLFLTGFLVIRLLTGCTESHSSRLVSTLSARQTAITQTGSSSVLLRHGHPFFIRGVGGQSRFGRLREAGGNSVRTWDDSDADHILNQAQQSGLTVFMGLWIERQKDGFNYYDQRAVDKQFERIRKTVLTYRHHPALLMWCVGNEWELDASNIRVFDEINRVAAMIHELDPDHPVATAIMLTTARQIRLVGDRCPEIDVLGINVYGALSQAQKLLQEGGWKRPYVVSEFGPRGYWESELTPWRTSIEPTSQEKYEFVRFNYEHYIDSRPPHCLGSYLFLWGTQEEGTHTWYSCFDEQGRETPLVGLMQRLWTKSAPDNQAPVVEYLLVDGRRTTAMSFADAKSIHQARIVTHDADGDSLSYAWEIRLDLDDFHTGVRNSAPSVPISGLITDWEAPEIQFGLPKQAGNYRLFAYVYDTHRHVATANLSFRVTAITAQQ